MKFLRITKEKLCFSDSANVNGRENVIVIHPDFRMIVLANRPGFPFLGNDFFGTLGKIIMITITKTIAITIILLS